MAKIVLDTEQVEHLHIDLKLPPQNLHLMWFWWNGYEDDKELTEAGCYGQEGNGEGTYTVSDITEVLPKTIIEEDKKYSLRIYYNEGKWRTDYYDITNNTEHPVLAWEDNEMVDSAYGLLCLMIRLNYIKTEKQ